jgi:hypothetical protein
VGPHLGRSVATAGRERRCAGKDRGDEPAAKAVRSRH